MTQKYLYVHGWREHQSYRADRGLPPWIKLHRSLIRNQKWLSLSEAERCHLVSIWILAADNDGRIVNDPEILKRACGLDSPPDINKLISLNLLDAKLTPTRRQHDANMTPTWRHGDAPEAETETETETETEKKESLVAFAPPPADAGMSDVEKAFSNYQIAARDFGLPVARVLTSDRRKKLAARLRELPGGLKDWNDALEKIADSPFCRGQNDNGWRADLDFMLQPKSLNRLMEGTYERKANGAG